MPSASKEKGNRFETETAEILTAWWGKPFKRMPTSGALRWNGAAFTYGDLLPPEDFPAIVECKFYKYVDFDEILRLPDTSGYISWWWWYQTLVDRDRCLAETEEDLIPWLIFKRNNGKPRLVLDCNYAVQFNVEVWMQLRYIHIGWPGKDSFVIVDLTSFLETFTPEDVTKAYQAYLSTRGILEVEQ